MESVVKMLNDTLENERALLTEYGTCKVLLRGPDVPLAFYFKKAGMDEVKHVCSLTRIIGFYLDSVPTTSSRKVEGGHFRKGMSGRDMVEDLIKHEKRAC
eukprot:TRINITY_DN911_c0_g1_i14.p5 TRINITY_DN911_c0_g1~~TRINITY_DN911_c0_g1_i14.p5  ORF type:complete len:100 (-),score=38.40 TRINITY_DN911_c0_g1_i14:1505-1804(-)